jgi:tetratricopeptide (TPR) repeat protein
VGRRREFDTLQQAFDQAVAERRCRLVTVLGTAGIGKSRLVREFLLESGREANVLVGRCLPYGDGITFWPVAEVLPDETFTGTTDEIFWRVRKRFEDLARERPLVLCFDDVHWAEPTFLNLIEYLHGWIAGAPVLLLCLARPDLNEHHPAWLSTHADTVVLTLAPLSGEEVTALVDALDAPSEARDRIAEAAEGNPLFVEQMAAMAAEEGSEFVVPPSIRALIAARIDRLTADERAVVERAAVFGREFPLRAVVELSPEDLRSSVAGTLLGLMRKELVSPAVIAFIDEDGFRFRHALIREVAYEGISKQVRADLHERCARWLDRNGGDDVIIGYHLEQAFQAREQIGRVDERAKAMGREAGELLRDAGSRAFRRSDMPAARNLLERAISLLPETHPERPELIRILANALWQLGDIVGTDRLLREVVETAVETGDRRTEWWARLDLASRRRLADPEGTDEVTRVAAEAAKIFEEVGDEAGVIRARRALGAAALSRGQYGRAEEELGRALEYAQRSGDAGEEARCADALCTALLYGPAEAKAATGRCREILERARGNPLLESNVASSLAGLEAMQGRFAEARSLYERARQIYSELGLRMQLVGLTQISGPIELLAGDPEAAERELREGYEILVSAGAKGFMAPQAALLASALVAQGRDDEAEPLVGLAEQSLASNELSSQTLVRTTRAMFDLRRGDMEGALSAIREAVAIGERTDALNLTADALVVLGYAHLQLRDPEQATQALETAVELYRRKGNLVATRRASMRLSAPVA